jgi:transcriptional regulator with XRE-family HTH domain
MRCFDSIAKLIKSKRLGHPKGYSQSELSHLLGYKNGQFISNVERGLCNIPLKMLNRISQILNITPEELKREILKDHEVTLNNFLEKGKEEDGSEVDSNRFSSAESDGPIPLHPQSKVHRF